MSVNIQELLLAEKKGAARRDQMRDDSLRLSMNHFSDFDMPRHVILPPFADSGLIYLTRVIEHQRRNANSGATAIRVASIPSGPHTSCCRYCLSTSLHSPK